ncbi:MAG: trigger factor, partial [Burkholderiales bacterium]
MSTVIEQISTLERRFTMAIPVERVNSETESRLKKIARTVKMQGFRPGKVPMKMVSSTYGPQVRSEVLGDEINRSFGEVVDANQIRVAGTPRVEPLPNPADQTKFEFVATFEVFPEVSFGDLSAMNVERPVVEITDADIDRTIDTLRKQRVTYTPKDSASEDGDRLIVDFKGVIDGQEFQGGSANDFTMVLGERRMLPEFETAARGLKKGESRSFDLTFPADYFGKDVAGKTATFSLTAKDVAAAVLPEVNTDFVKAFGVPSGDVAELRKEVKSNLELERKRRVFQAVREQVFKSLRAQANVEIPRSLIAEEAQRMAQNASQEL